MPGQILRLAISAVAIAVLSVMTTGSMQGGDNPDGAEGYGTTASHSGGPPPPPAIRPGMGRGPMVLAEAVDSTPTVVSQGRRFSPDALVVPDQRTIDLTFENRDADSTHSLHLRIPGRDPVVVAVGPDKLVLRFRSPDPGRYRFVCDVHRAMQGTLFVVRAKR